MALGPANSSAAFPRAGKELDIQIHFSEQPINPFFTMHSPAASSLAWTGPTFAEQYGTRGPWPAVGYHSPSAKRSLQQLQGTSAPAIKGCPITGTPSATDGSWTVYALTGALSPGSGT